MDVEQIESLTMQQTMRRVMQSPTSRAVILCLSLLLLSLAFTSTIALQPNQTQPQALRLLLGMGLFVVLRNYLRHQPRLLTRLPQWLTLTGIGLALLAPLSVRWNPSKTPLIPTETYQMLPLQFSDSIHPNVMAGYLLLLLPFPLTELYWQRQTHSKIHNFIKVCALTLMTFVLLATQSRAALIAFAVALLALVSLTRGKRWQIFATILLISLLASGVWLFATANTLEISQTIRREAWQRAVYLVQDFPLGVGMGQYTPMVARFYPFFFSLPDEVPHAHNLLLQIAVDLGLPGLFAWLALFGIVLQASWQVFGQYNRSLGGGLLLGQIALFTHGIFDAVTWGMVRPAIVIWLLWAIALAAYDQLPPQPTAPNHKISGFIFSTWIVLTLWAAWYSCATYRALDGLRPQAITAPTADAQLCESLAPDNFSTLRPPVRAAFGSALLFAGCPDRAAQILPPFDPQAPRSPLLAYHWGRVFWLRGDIIQAAQSWRHAPEIINLLILQAQRFPASTPLQQAESHFRTTVLAASTRPNFVAALFWYTNFLNNHPNDFDRAALTISLSTAYPPNSAEQIRLQAQSAIARRDFAQAEQYLSQALALGMNDSETWFLLAEILRLKSDFAGAHAAYTAALDARIQVASYRTAHYAYRLAILLIDENRPQVALPLLEQAAAQNPSYWLYWDELSQLYALLGQTQNANTACRRAAALLPEDTGVALKCVP